jgi:hypothetical protein
MPGTVLALRESAMGNLEGGAVIAQRELIMCSIDAP